MSARLPDQSLTRVYRLEATLGEPLNLGDLARGCRRIEWLNEGVFIGVGARQPGGVIYETYLVG